MAKKVSRGRKAAKSAAPHKPSASLSNLKPPKGSRHRKVRVGRGGLDQHRNTLGTP